MRILILDDVEVRHTTLKSYHKDDEVDSAYNIDEAKAFASANKYDLMYLDHDLEDEHYTKPVDQYSEKARGRTGLDFARWLVETKNYPIKVIVHSMNTYGAKSMWKTLDKYCDAYPVSFVYAGNEWTWKFYCKL